MSRGRRSWLVAALATVAAIVPASAAALPGNGRVAVISGELGNGRIHLVQPDGSGSTQLTTQPVRTDAQWSPDGTQVAFTGTNGDFNDAYKINDDGTGLTRLTNDGTVCCPQWLPDASQLLLSAMRVVNADGTNLRSIGSGFTGGWSPDGTKVVFSSRSALGQPADIWVVNRDGTGTQQLTSNATSEQAIAYSPDGSKILFLAGSDIWTINANGSSPQNLTNSPSREFGASWSPDGERILFVTNLNAPDFINGTLTSMQADGTDVRPLTTGATGIWSPDGTKIAFSRYDPNTEESAAYTMNADGTGVVPIRNTAFVDDLVADWEPVPVVNRAPDCSTVTAALTILGGKADLISAQLQGATDPDGDEVALRVTGVTQDEPLTGPGDKTSTDALAGATPDEVRVRNEASNKGDGRVYRIAFEGDDGRGGTCTGVVKVSVPRKGQAIDSAPPSYDSFGS
jgi:Tol biopolymer transport system component